MKINILFTGVGRRVELIQAFREAALCLNIDLKIFGADMLGTAPALTFCDYTRKVCGMKEKEYICQLLEICQNDDIDLLIPTIDTDLMVLAENKDRFKKIGTEVLISKKEMIAICRDKNNTADFFEACGLLAPKTYNEYSIYEGPFPCFIKPKDGSSSIDAYKVETRDDLRVFAEKVQDYIIQPFVSGTEYTIDIFCDFEGKPIYITPRIRMAVRSGEVLKTKIVMDEVMIEESKAIINKFKPCGPLTVQLIRDEVTGKDYYIEINPRYGGGAPLSMRAGARSAEAILRLLCNMDLVDSKISDGAIYSRFDNCVCIQEGKQRPIQGVIFDLDDTLYSEKEYVRSGYRAVAKYLGNSDYYNILWSMFNDGKLAIDELLSQINRIDEKEKCLKVYREHMPKISLYEGVLDTINELHNKNIKVGIITDGRVEGQKNKLTALKLEKLVDDIIITDELGGPQFRKPNDISFRIMQCRWKIPYEQIMYVGDNLEKDFQAPKRLGMQFLWYRNKEGIYYNDMNAIPNITEIRNVMNNL